MSSEFIPKSAMAIVAHPDDIEFGAAGTLAKWAKHGAKIIYVHVTSGNGGTHDPKYNRQTIAELREQEETAAAAVCGVHDLEFLHYNDGEVMPTLELRKDLIRVIRKHKPEVVVAMDPTRMFSGNGYINHPDHRAVAVATMDAIAPVASMPLMYPELGPAHAVSEVWIQWSENADTWVDISETIEIKAKALAEHKSQIGEDVVKRIREWALGEGKGLVPAESFRIIYLIKRDDPARTGTPAEKVEAAIETRQEAFAEATAGDVEANVNGTGTAQS